jgi:hypothetical protein
MQQVFAGIATPWERECHPFEPAEGEEDRDATAVAVAAADAAMAAEDDEAARCGYGAGVPVLPLEGARAIFMDPSHHAGSRRVQQCMAKRWGAAEEGAKERKEALPGTARFLE